ncbi:MAG: MFS transporter, partial [Moraxellaceae bacterium]
MTAFNSRQVSLLVIMLYLAHALPLYFFNVALPAILRQQGVDLRWIG